MTRVWLRFGKGMVKTKTFLRKHHNHSSTVCKSVRDVLIPKRRVQLCCSNGSSRLRYFQRQNKLTFSLQAILSTFRLISKEMPQLKVILTINPAFEAVVAAKANQIKTLQILFFISITSTRTADKQLLLMKVLSYKLLKIIKVWCMGNQLYCFQSSF